MLHVLPTLGHLSHAMPGMQSQAAEQVSAMIFGGVQ
jgi:hypothetical protein